GALAWFECERRTQALHGDHWLFIGEVKRSAATDGSPLIFRHGEFAVADSLQSQAADPSSEGAWRATGAPSAAASRANLPGAPAGAATPATEPGGLEPGDQPFYEEYLPFLLARAGHQVEAGFH